jgi:hypothetical protein
MRARAHRAGDFSNCHNVSRSFQPLERAAEFVVHQGQFQAKCRRLGMDAVAAADSGRELMLLRARGDGGQQLADIGNQNFRALFHLHGQGCVYNVAARQAKMKPATGAIVDFFSDGGGKADDIVIERLFEFFLAFDEPFRVGKAVVGAGFDFLKVVFGNDAFGDERLGSEDFNLQPDFEPVFIGPNAPHFGARITRNHTSLNGKRREYEMQIGRYGVQGMRISGSLFCTQISMVFGPNRRKRPIQQNGCNNQDLCYNDELCIQETLGSRSRSLKQMLGSRSRSLKQLVYVILVQWFGIHSFHFPPSNDKQGPYTCSIVVKLYA